MTTEPTALASTDPTVTMQLPTPAAALRPFVVRGDNPLAYRLVETLTTQYDGEPQGQRLIVTGRVLDSDGYWDAVTNEMRALGYCAVNDGEELAVKNTNSWNDQYDIISGDGIVRRGAGSYRSTCHPAWF